MLELKNNTPTKLKILKDLIDLVDLQQMAQMRRKKWEEEVLKEPNTT